MKMKHVLLLASSLFLTSCVAVVVAGAAAGMIVYEKRSLRMMEKDTRIYNTIHSQIVQDPEFKNSRIIVSSFNQVVLLIGQTDSASLRVKAEKIARDTSNVYRVYDEIVISDPIPYSQRSKDTWITSQVRSLMLTKKGLESGSIRIVTDNSVVYLMGIATPEQANLAVDVARRIDGVRKVVKIFRYIN